MKKILTALFLLLASVAFSQDCKTLAAGKPSTYDANYQSFANTVSNVKPASWNISNLKPRLAKVESWMRNILKGFTGAKLMYGNTYFLDPLDFNYAGPEVGNRSLTTLFYQATGIKGYSQGRMMFFAYYCHDNNNKIFTESESGSSMNVVLNNVFASGLCSDIGVYTINGKFTFRVLEKTSTEGRIDYYDLRKRMTFADTVFTSKADYFLVRNSNKPVYLPITRKEYLEQLLKDIETSMTNDTKSFTEMYNRNIKQFEEEMKVYKAMDKSYTPEKEAKRRKWFGEDQQKLQSLISKIKPNTDVSVEVVKQYLQKPADWLGRGIGSFYSGSYTANGIKTYFDNLDVHKESKEDYTRSEVVYINPAYFNKTISMDVPQLLLVTLNKAGYHYMYKLSELIKKPGALAPLETILHL